MRVSCPCLNVSVHTAGDSLDGLQPVDNQQPDQQPDSNQPDGLLVPLRSIQPVSFEHPVLRSISVLPSKWVAVSCLNCKARVVSFLPNGSLQTSMLAATAASTAVSSRVWLDALLPDDRTVVLSREVIHGDAIERVKDDPDYAPAFRILLRSKQALEAAASDGQPQSEHADDRPEPSTGTAPSSSAAAAATIADPDPALLGRSYPVPSGLGSIRQASAGAFFSPSSSLPSSFDIPATAGAPGRQRDRVAALFDTSVAKYMATRRAETEDRIAAFRRRLETELVDIQADVETQRDRLVDLYVTAMADAETRGDVVGAGLAIDAVPAWTGTGYGMAGTPPQLPPVTSILSASVGRGGISGFAGLASQAESKTPTPADVDGSSGAGSGSQDAEGLVLGRETTPKATTSRTRLSQLQVHKTSTSPSAQPLSPSKAVHFSDTQLGDGAGGQGRNDNNGNGNDDDDDDDALFDLDDMTVRPTTKFTVADDHGSDDDGATSGTKSLDSTPPFVVGSAQSQALLSMSLPIRIPQQFHTAGVTTDAATAAAASAAAVEAAASGSSGLLARERAAGLVGGFAEQEAGGEMGGDGNDDQEFEDGSPPPFEPPHVMSARTYAGSSFLSTRPFNRKSSVI